MIAIRHGHVIGRLTVGTGIALVTLFAFVALVTFFAFLTSSPNQGIKPFFFCSFKALFHCKFIGGLTVSAGGTSIALIAFVTFLALSASISFFTCGPDQGIQPFIQCSGIALFNCEVIG